MLSSTPEGERRPEPTVDAGVRSTGVEDLLEVRTGGAFTHLFTELLAERDGIAVSRDFVGVRLILLGAGLRSPPLILIFFAASTRKPAR
jgi:hypothetical protein